MMERCLEKFTPLVDDFSAGTDWEVRILSVHFPDASFNLQIMDNTLHLVAIEVTVITSINHNIHRDMIFAKV
jgi:hypothetical protein